MLSVLFLWFKHQSGAPLSTTINIKIKKHCIHDQWNVRTWEEIPHSLSHVSVVLLKSKCTSFSMQVITFGTFGEPPSPLPFETGVDACNITNKCMHCLSPCDVVQIKWTFNIPDTTPHINTHTLQSNPCKYLNHARNYLNCTVALRFPEIRKRIHIYCWEFKKEKISLPKQAYMTWKDRRMRGSWVSHFWISQTFHKPEVRQSVSPLTLKIMRVWYWNTHTPRTRC